MAKGNKDDNAGDSPAVTRVEISEVDGRASTRIIIGEDSEGESSVSSVFTMCNSCIGAGVLSLPYAFYCAGWLGCLLLCLILGALEAFTLYILAKFAERYSATTYSVLVRKALGRKLSASLSAILLLYLWGSCIAYLVIIGDSFSSITSLYTDGIWADRRVLITSIGLLVTLPLCFPRNLGALAWVSVSAVFGFLFVVVAVVLRSTQIVKCSAAVFGFLFVVVAVMLRRTQIVKARFPGHRWDDAAMFKFDLQALSAIPIVVFGFNCHANVVTIMSELEKVPSLLIAGMPRHPDDYQVLTGSFLPRPRTRKLIGMLSVIAASVAVIMLGYLAVGFAGYLAFPAEVASNILNSFASQDHLMLVTRGIIGCVVVGHYPLNHHPARLALEDLEAYAFDWRSISPALSSAQTTLFVLTSVAVAEVVTDLGAVLQLIGGTAASFMIFFLPGLLLINAAIVKHQEYEEAIDVEYDEEDEDGTPMAAQEGELSIDPFSNRSYLANPNERGIKRMGIIYSPRKSWWIGVLLVALSAAILFVTLLTAFI